MKKIEKRFKDYMEKQIPVKNSYQDIVKRIDFEEGEKNMNKKKLIPLICGGATVAVVACVAIVGMGLNKPGKDPKAKGIVSIDVNPSIELVVNDENVVMSINGLNEDGKMIIVDEEIVGKTLDEAVEIIITLEKETGFLTSGRVEASENEIKISVNADNDEAINELESKIRTTIGTVCDELKINESITKIEKYNRQILEEKVIEIDPTLEGKVSEMTYEELLDVINLHHLEMVDIYSQKLEELYIDAKNSEISFVEKESIQNTINNMDSIYQSFLESYSNLVTSLKSISENLETMRYDLLIDPESSYQSAVVEVNNKKSELNALKQEIANQEEPSILQQVELGVKETLLETAESLLATVESATNTTIDTIQKSLEEVITNLEQQEENFPEEIKTQLNSKAQEIETSINESKDAFFTEFETKYAEDIQRIKQDAIARKQALIESIKSN